VFSVHKSKNPL